MRCCCDEGPRSPLGAGWLVGAGCNAGALTSAASVGGVRAGRAFVDWAARPPPPSRRGGRVAIT
eukprot:11191851-Lingulodinium_polyedra.AAC.1